MAKDMARLEWAHIEAFDSASLPKVEPDQILGVDPSSVNLRLQPYVGLLKLSHAVDEMLLEIRRTNRDQFREEASNATVEKGDRNQLRARPAPRKEDVYLAVHRYRNSVFYKRLRADEYAILNSLSEGMNLEESLEQGVQKVEGPIDEWSKELRESFESWTQLEWFSQAS